MTPQPQQAAAIPFRRSGDGVSVCLITAAASNVWTIPKGTIERGMSPAETAVQETWEEAGLRGHILGPPLGTFEYEKGGVLLTVEVYLMKVESEAKEWDEQAIRRRRWVSASDAVRLLEEHPAHALVEEACKKLAKV